MSLGFTHRCNDHELLELAGVGLPVLDPARVFEAFFLGIHHEYL